MRLKGLAMALKKIKLGNCLELVEIKNSDNNFGLENVRGISTQKCFIDTKANMDGVPLTGYKVVPPNCFAYVPDTSRRGDKISLAYNNSEDYFLVSSISVIFKVKDESVLNSQYLFMYFNRPEFDRYTRYHSFGSAREPFNWEDMCDIEILLPELETQIMYKDVYLSFLKNQECYQKGLEDLKTAIDLLLDKNKKINHLELKKIFKMNNCINSNGVVPFENLRGINEDCEFTGTRDSIREEDILKYKIIKPAEFALNFMCLGNFGKFYLAYNDSDSNYIVSPACVGAQLINEKIDPYYLLAFLRRDEFQRKCVFCGDGNTRGGMNFDDFCNLSIPVPDINIQKSIGSLYKAYDYRRQLNNELKDMVKNYCSILFVGSIAEK